MGIGEQYEFEKTGRIEPESQVALILSWEARLRRAVAVNNLPQQVLEDIAMALHELARFRRGEFTEAEFQNLCHNLSEDDACRFRAGCVAYQEKLFGKQFELEKTGRIEPESHIDPTVRFPAWQPIATVPKDGTPVLCYEPPATGRDARIMTAQWNGEEQELGGKYWSYVSASYPTHWMPMIPAPNRISSMTGYCTHCECWHLQGQICPESVGLPPEPVHSGDALFENARERGTAVSSVCDYRGMASVQVIWNPYVCMWEAACSWSDNSKITSMHERAPQALIALEKALTEEYERCAALWQAGKG